MKSTGHYSLVEDDFELNLKIYEVTELTQKFITDLINEVGVVDYKKLAIIIIQKHLNAVQNLQNYGNHYGIG